MVEEKKKGKADQIREWWAANPMTYGNMHGDARYEKNGKTLAPEFGSREFFEMADQRFYSWNTPLHTARGKFGKIFDYDAYHGKSVLEVGSGMGCMAMNWAQHGANVTAVDLNPVAVEQTKRRFELFDLKANVREMDSRELEFKNNSFDLVYSWGVLHHSPDLERSFAEITRVLKPGGTIGIMLYNRRSLLYWYTIAILEGLVHMENKFLKPLELASRYGDGDREEGNFHTWPVTKQEMHRMLGKNFSNLKIDVFGTDVEYVFDTALPRLGKWLVPGFIQRALGRRWGWSLWITGRKI